MHTKSCQGAGRANSGAYYYGADSACGLNRSAHGFATSVSTQLWERHFRCLLFRCRLGMQPLGKRPRSLGLRPRYHCSCRMQTDRSTNKQTDRLKTAKVQGAPIPVLIILVQIRHAASRPAASIARPTASLPLCPRNYGRGLLIYA